MNRSRATIVVAVLTAVLSTATKARADEDETVSLPMLAVAAGAATSFGSIAYGAIKTSRSSTRTGKNAGLIGGLAGLTLAPFVAHAVVGEPGRGALFSLIPLAGLAANVTLAATTPDFIAHAPPPIQYTTFIGVGVAILGTTFGIVDAARIDERKRRVGVGWLDRLKIFPIVGREGTGAGVGGVL